MTLLLEFREKLKGFYGRYSLFLQPLLKFILAFAVFKGINLYLPYVAVLDNIFVLLIMALICCILPLNCTAAFGILLVVGQCYGVGLEAAGFALCLFLIMVILYIRFTPQDAIVLLLAPLAFALRIPCVIPIGYGLTRTPASAVSASFGVIIYYFLELVHASAGMLQGNDTEQMANNLKMLLDGLVKNQNMMMNIIAFVTVLLAVNVIRRLSVNYAWQIAIFTGGIAYIIIMVAGGLMIGAEIQTLPLIAGTVGAVLVSLILEFFLFNVDYTRTEFIQYEDDEYYYYVKAVPKRSIAQKKVVVKTIRDDQPSAGGRFQTSSGTPAGQPGPGSEQIFMGREGRPVQEPSGPDNRTQNPGMPGEFRNTGAAGYPGGQGPVPQETVAFTGLTRELGNVPSGGMEAAGPAAGEIRQENRVPEKADPDPVKADPETVDFEAKLEESLKNLQS